MHSINTQNSATQKKSSEQLATTISCKNMIFDELQITKKHQQQDLLLVNNSIAF